MSNPNLDGFEGTIDELESDFFEPILAAHKMCFERIDQDGVTASLAVLSNFQRRLVDEWPEVRSKLVRFCLASVPASFQQDAVAKIIAIEAVFREAINPLIEISRYPKLSIVDEEEGIEYELTDEPMLAKLKLQARLPAWQNAFQELRKMAAYFQDTTADHPLHESGAKLTTPSRPQRLRLDSETQSVWLDGQIIGENINPKAFQFFKKIAESEGNIVSGDILRTLPGARGAKLGRFLKKLPPAVKKLVQSKPRAGGGYWLRLPSPKSCP